MAPAAQLISNGVREGRNKKDLSIIPSRRILRSHTKSKCKQFGTVKKLHNCNCYQTLDDYRKRKSAAPTPKRRQKAAQEPVTSSNTIDASGSSHPKIETEMGTLQKEEKVLMENTSNNNSWMNYQIGIKYSVLKIKKRWSLIFQDYTRSKEEKENVLINDVWKNGFHKKFGYRYMY